MPIQCLSIADNQEAVYQLHSDPSNVRALSVKTSAAFRKEVFSEKDKNMMVKYRILKQAGTGAVSMTKSVHLLSSKWSLREACHCWTR